MNILKILPLALVLTFLSLETRAASLRLNAQPSAVDAGQFHELISYIAGKQPGEEIQIELLGCGGIFNEQILVPFCTAREKATNRTLRIMARPDKALALRSLLNALVEEASPGISRTIGSVACDTEANCEVAIQPRNQ